MGKTIRGPVGPALIGQLDVLLDPDDDVTVTHGLLERHDLAAGRVVVHPTATTRQLLSLAYDVLAALGVPPGTLGLERVGLADTAWAAVRAKMLAARIRHLVVLRAHRLEPHAWTGLAYLARTTMVQVLLVSHTRTIPPRLTADLGSLDIWPFDSLAKVIDTYRWDTEPLPVRRRPAPPIWPELPARLPTGQVLHYRADVYRQAGPEVFARVDALYQGGLDAACIWLRGRPIPDRSQPAAGEPIQQFVTQLVHASPGPRHTLALLRGAQAGFVLHGAWLTIPALTRLGGPGLTSLPVTHEVAERISTLSANPVLAAGIALSLSAGLTPTALRTMTIEALERPWHRLSVPHKKQLVPTELSRKFTSDRPIHPNAVFYVPMPARSLLRTADEFLSELAQDSSQKIFRSFARIHLALTEAADRYAVALPRRPVDMIALWQLRVRWDWLGEPFHPDPPHPHRSAGLACHTAVPPAPAASSPVRADGRRSPWSPRGARPQVVPRLIRAHVDLAHPQIPPVLVGEDGLPSRYPRYPRYLGRLIRQQLATWTPAESGSGRRLTVHPDVAFALGLVDRPR
jgi:hypothetical protein